MPYPRKTLLAALALAAGVALGSLSLSGVPSPALSLGWYGAGYCDDAEAANPGDPNGCRYDGREADCGNGVDDDSDERTDCLDPDCAGAAGCACVPAPEICGDNVDQDCDGYDTACCPWWNPLCATEETECGDAVDNDEDGLADCRDTDCWGTSGSCPTGGEVCRNGADDDGDGQVDCWDQNCTQATECWACLNRGDAGDCDPICAPSPEICGDGIDQDCDGQDLSCGCPWWNPWCTVTCPPGLVRVGSACVSPVEICGNGVDDNANGLIDCADATCAVLGGCSETVCDDGKDNDGDGPVDCADSDCGGDISCMSGYCGDGKDNDNDGDVDETPYMDQNGSAECPEVESEMGAGIQGDLRPACNDGSDNDSNGQKDCRDSSCNNKLTKIVDLTEIKVRYEGCENGRNNQEFLIQDNADQCMDGKDNDNNGLTDYEDPACGSQGPEGWPLATNPDQCQDGMDNEIAPDPNVGDGADCEDPECLTRPECETEGVCDDDVDNDADGMTDCQDADCNNATTHGPGGKDDRSFNPTENQTVDQAYVCANGGAVLNQNQPRECRECCNNGTDDDKDGRIDQQFGNDDWECQGYLFP